jgi:hypothetical protein
MVEDNKIMIVHERPYKTKWFYREWIATWTVWSVGFQIERDSWSFDTFEIYFGPITWVFSGERVHYDKD